MQFFPTCVSFFYHLITKGRITKGSSASWHCPQSVCRVLGSERWRSCVCVSVCVCTYLSCVGGGARALWGEALPPSLPSPRPIQPEHPQMHTLTGSRALKTQFHFPIHKYLCKSGHSKPNHLPMSHTKCEDTWITRMPPQLKILEWVAISFSRGIFPTQGSNLGLLHCRLMLRLNHQRSPESKF